MSAPDIDGGEKRSCGFDQDWRRLEGSLQRVREWLARDEAVPPLTFSLVCDIEKICAALAALPLSPEKGSVG